MTEVLFVQANENRLEMRACEIAEHTYAQDQRLQIIAANEEQATRLDNLLWTYKLDNFVPHGIWKGSENQVAQPVVITNRQERVPGIEYLLMLDYCEVELVGQFSHAVHMVVADNRDRLEASRRYWTQLKEAGFALRHQKR